MFQGICFCSTSNLLQNNESKSLFICWTCLMCQHLQQQVLTPEEQNIFVIALLRNASYELFLIQHQSPKMDKLVVFMLERSITLPRAQHKTQPCLNKAAFPIRIISFVFFLCFMYEGAKSFFSIVHRLQLHPIHRGSQDTAGHLNQELVLRYIFIVEKSE